FDDDAEIVVVAWPLEAARQCLGPIPRDPERDERMRGPLTHDGRHLWAIHHANAAAHHRLTLRIERQREAGARSDVHRSIRLVRLQRIQRRAEVHLPQIGWRREVDDLHREVGRRHELDGTVIVVADTEVQHETAADAPVVLKESAELVHVRLVRWRAERGPDEAWNVGEQIGLVLELEYGIFRIAAAAGLAGPANASLQE